MNPEGDRTQIPRIHEAHKDGSPEGETRTRSPRIHKERKNNGVEKETRTRRPRIHQGNMNAPQGAPRARIPRTPKEGRTTIDGRKSSDSQSRPTRRRSAQRTFS